MSAIRVPLDTSEPLSEGLSQVRVPVDVSEPLSEGLPQVRVALDVAEPLSEGLSRIRVAVDVLEALEPVPEEREMLTDTFPALAGLTYDSKKAPTFNTGEHNAPNLKSYRNAYAQFPAWDFKVQFEYLPDDEGQPNVALGATDYAYLCGFFVQQMGMAGDWLYRDPTDNTVTGDNLLRITDALTGGDGVTTEFWFARQMGPALEPVGQVDQAVRFTFAPSDVNAGADTITHAAHGLATGDGPMFVASTLSVPAGLVALTPYWVIAVDANTIKLAATKALALAGTPVNITGAGSGVETLTGGFAVYINGVAQAPAAFTFVVPNRLTWAVAPLLNDVVTGDFRFFFVCHFLQDAADFQLWADKLWQLGQIEFRGEPQ